MFGGARLDAGMFTSAMNEVLDRCDAPFRPMDPDMVGDGDIEITRFQNRNYCIAEGFRRFANESNAIGLMLRYRVQAEREYRRAIEDLDRLKALRDEMPNGPDVGIERENIDKATPKEICHWIEMTWPVPAEPHSGRAPKGSRARAAAGSLTKAAKGVCRFSLAHGLRPYSLP